MIKDLLKDVTEGGLVFVDRMEAGQEVKQAFPEMIFEIHKYAAGVYGIPVTKGGKQAILRLATNNAKSRFSAMLIDFGWAPWVPSKALEQA